MFRHNVGLYIVDFLFLISSVVFFRSLMPAGLPDTQGMRRPRAFTFHVRRASSLGSSCGRTCFHAANKVTAKARVFPVCSSRTKVMFVRACAHFLAFGECASCWTWPYTAKRLPGEHAAADNS